MIHTRVYLHFLLYYFAAILRRRPRCYPYNGLAMLQLGTSVQNGNGHYGQRLFERVILSVTLFHRHVHHLLRLHKLASLSRNTSSSLLMRRLCGRGRTFVGGIGVRNHLLPYRNWGSFFNPLCVCVPEETLTYIGPFDLVSLNTNAVKGDMA